MGFKKSPKLLFFCGKKASKYKGKWDLAFLFFAVTELAFAVLLRKVTQERRPAYVPVLWSLLAILIETISILPIPFFAMYSLRHWQLPVVLGIMAAAMALLACFVPKTKEELTYTKQFE